MTISLNKTLLFLLLGAGAAVAAPQPPRSLGPALEDSRGANTAQVNTTMDDEDTPPPTISVAPVGKPVIDGYGTMDESNGGLPATIWKGSTRDSAAPLLHYIRAGVADDTIKALVTRLLMTQAAPPEGSGEDWFALRVNALVALGEDDKAQQMIDSLPVSMISDPLYRTRAELTLLRGDADGACKWLADTPAGQAAVATGDGFWQKLNIFCQAHAGKQTEAMVGLDVLREQNQDDPFFQEIIRRLADKNATVKTSPKQWSLFDVALMRLAGEGDRLKDKLDVLPPVTLKYMAQDATLDVKLREKASAKAQLLGILPGRDANKTPEQPFERSLASDVTTLVAAFKSGKPANSGDEAVIGRLAIDEGVAIQDSRRVERLLTLMEPFGFSVPPAVWQKLFVHKNRFDGEVPPAMLVSRLNEAAAAGRKGEVIVLAALIAGGNDVDRISDLALLPLIKALKAVGFDTEARAVAVSAVKDYSER